MVGICFPVALPQAGMMRTFGPGSVAAELRKRVKQIPFGNDRQEKQGQRQVQQQVLRLRYALLRMTTDCGWVHLAGWWLGSRDLRWFSMLRTLRFMAVQ